MNKTFSQNRMIEPSAMDASRASPERGPVLAAVKLATSTAALVIESGQPLERLDEINERTTDYLLTLLTDGRASDQGNPAGGGNGLTTNEASQ